MANKIIILLLLLNLSGIAMIVYLNRNRQSFKGLRTRRRRLFR